MHNYSSNVQICCNKKNDSASKSACQIIFGWDRFNSIIFLVSIALFAIWAGVYFSTIIPKTSEAGNHESSGHGGGHEGGHGTGHDVGHEAAHKTGHEAEHKAGHETGHKTGHVTGSETGQSVAPEGAPKAAHEHH